MKVTIPCHYYLQWDNKLHPGGSCNITCAAMVLKTLGTVFPKFGYDRLPDNLMAWVESKGLDRHTLETIDAAIEAFGLKDKSSYTTKPAELKEHVKKGGLAIVHGNFTPSGHIIVLRGVDEENGKWFINDPAGVWTSTGYDSYSSGEGRWVESKWLWDMIAPDGVVWAHLIRK